MPSSRDTITAWLIRAPTFTTTAADGRNSGVQAGSVIGATSTSPGSRSTASAGSMTTRARPLATPWHPAAPVRTSPGTATGTAERAAWSASNSSMVGTSSWEVMKNRGSTAV